MRSTFFVVPLLASLLVGCHAAAIDDRANAEIQDVRTAAEHRAVYPTCRDPSAITPGCGLLLVRASRDDVRAAFKEKRCASKSDDQCQELYAQTLDAQLGRRYFAADWDAIARTCDTDSGRCDDPKAYELMLLDSHNANVRDRAARDENAIEDRRAAEHRADVAHGIAVSTEVLGAIDYATHKGPKCRSYPSVLSGVTSTVCSP